MADPLTIVFRARVKAGMEADFRNLAAESQAASRAEDGCITFNYHQSRDDPAEFMLYEQWRDGDALQGHLAKLREAYGPPPPAAEGAKQSPFPAKLESYWEEHSAEFFELVD